MTKSSSGFGIIRYNPAMKTVMIFLLLALQVYADALINSMVESNATKALHSIDNGYRAPTEDEKRLNATAGTKKRALDGIAIKVIEANISKDLSIGVEYAPPLQHGELIDNREKGEIKLDYRF